MPPANFKLVARTGHPDFLDLPWEQPLEDWRSERIVKIIRGISRHVVRFVEYEGVLYALKELPERPARREWMLLRRLEGQDLPVVEAVGIVTGRGSDLDAVLITRHLEYSLPYRVLFTGQGIPDLRTHLLNALAELLTRLHIRGFFWGDCSLSNALFRRDAGALTAYLVDAETGELHGALSDGQRAYDLDIAQMNILGELLDVDAEVGLPDDLDPEETGEEIVRRYEALWSELTREEVFKADERYKLDERLHRLNALGFDVEEIQLDATPGGYRLQLDPHVVEPGHHRHRLLRLTGLDAQERQARRMLNDIARFREALERELKRTLPDSVVASRWREEVFEPTVNALPENLHGRLPAAEVFHQVLEHRWFLSEEAGKDVGIDEAVTSYVERELPQRPAERVVLEGPPLMRRNRVDIYRTADERFENLPDFDFAPRYLDQDGLRMHYLDEGEGKPVLLLHGEPTWAFLYRKLIPELTGTARCLAPDYFGFGRSDKPTERGWYSYDSHAAAIARFAEELDLRETTVVVQDWGGPIGFRFAVENPDRVERLVVMNTGIGARAPGEEWLRFQAFMRRVDTDIVAGQLVQMTLVQPTTDEVIAGYDAPFPVPESRVGIAQFPELVATSADHPSAPKMLEVREQLRSFDRPALILFGESDPIFSRRAAELMAELLPGAELDPPVEGAGHFLQEDRGVELGQRIARWLL